MSTSPAQLVFDGILTTNHIYRTAKVNMKEMDLCTGLSKDEFPDLLESENTPGQFYLSNCAKSLANGDILTSDQWPALTTWQAGLSCQIYLKPLQQGMVINIFGTGFQSEFENAKGAIKVSAHEKYQQFLCYELHRGTPIPAGVGIERDGENHVCLYPTGDRCAVSAVSHGHDSFVINALQEITHLWKPFALLKMKACGYHWPSVFPPDSEHFPLRRWVQAVVLGGEADLAVAVAYSAEDFTAGVIGWVNFFKTVLSVGGRFGLMCSYEECILNFTLMTAVRFALHFAKLSDQNRKSLLLKSTTLQDQPAQEAALAQDFHSELDTGARKSLGLEGGLSFVSAVASINILFADSCLTAPSDQPVLPFTLVVDGCVILFDSLDPSPVFESGNSEADSRALHRFPSYCNADLAAAALSDTSQDSVTVVEADATASFEVLLPLNVLADVLSQCTQCYGYTLGGNRCNNQRRPASGKRGAPVWCHHHSAQERMFNQFLFVGERPSQCEWWERYDYEELVMGGRKLSV